MAILPKNAITMAVVAIPVALSMARAMGQGNPLIKVS
jgi:hypothetical protein